jgi:hypothetical protein
MTPFWNYLADIRTEAWLNLYREYVNGKLFAVLSACIMKKGSGVLMLIC